MMKELILEQSGMKISLNMLRIVDISLHCCQNVRRHIVGGENRTLISVKTPLRLCRTGTCRKLSAERPQIVVALFERQLVLLLK